MYDEILLILILLITYTRSPLSSLIICVGTMSWRSPLNKPWGPPILDTAKPRSFSCLWRNAFNDDVLPYLFTQLPELTTFRGDDEHEVLLLFELYNIATWAWACACACAWSWRNCWCCCCCSMKSPPLGPNAFGSECKNPRLARDVAGQGCVCCPS